MYSINKDIINVTFSIAIEFVLETNIYLWIMPWNKAFVLNTISYIFFIIKYEPRVILKCVMTPCDQCKHIKKYVSAIWKNLMKILIGCHYFHFFTFINNSDNGYNSYKKMLKLNGIIY